MVSLCSSASGLYAHCLASHIFMSFSVWFGYRCFKACPSCKCSFPFSLARCKKRLFLMYTSGLCCSSKSSFQSHGKNHLFTLVSNNRSFESFRKYFPPWNQCLSISANSCKVSFPTCQVRAVRVYVGLISWLPRPPRLPLPPPPCGLLCCDHLRPVFLAGPQPGSSAACVPCRTSTATICGRSLVAPHTPASCSIKPLFSCSS